MHVIARIGLADNYWKSIYRKWSTVEAERSKKTSQFQPKTFCPDPVPPLYKVLAPPLLDRFCSNFGSRRGKQFWTKSQSFKTLRQTVSELKSENRWWQNLPPPPPARKRVNKYLKQIPSITKHNNPTKDGLKKSCATLVQGLVKAIMISEGQLGGPYTLPYIQGDHWWMSKSIGLLQGFILCWQIRKPRYGWNNRRSFGIKQVSSSCCISNAYSRWSKQTSFEVTFPPARPPAPYDHRLPSICRVVVGCCADFPHLIKGTHPAEFLYKGNHFWCQTMYFFKLPPSR